MAATVYEFQPARGDWTEISRELSGKEAAVELLKVLMAGRRPLCDEDGAMVAFSNTEWVCLSTEGRDLLRSVEAYLLWRHASLCRDLGRQLGQQTIGERL